MACSSSSLCSTPHPFQPPLSLHFIHRHHLPLNLPPPFRFKILKFTPNCSSSTSSHAAMQKDTDQIGRRTVEINEQVQRKKKSSQKLKPSFYDQISEKWSRRPTITTKLPWHRDETVILETVKSVEVEDGVKSAIKEVSGGIRPWNDSLSSPPSSSSPGTESIDGGGVSSSVGLAPWERKSRKHQLSSERNSVEKPSENQGVSVMGDNLVGADEVSGLGRSVKLERELGFGGKLDASDDVNNARGAASGEAGLPWERRMSDSGDKVGGRMKSGNAELAEKSIPEHELRRLRNVALRMLERIKVGEAGITQAIVDEIHKKWKVDDIVKLKFEGSLAINMKRTHETLERKTGGLVIWRSGSSVVLFRGMNYKLDCVQSYNKQKSSDLQYTQYVEKSALSDSLKLPSGLSEEELMDVTELQNLLLDLGPPFEDWTCSNPKPVDADLLPGMIPGYRRPFRRLPHGVRLALRNKEMTLFRRQARRIRPHFALGRNKALEGLAAAMAKLWEKSAIAKIAIKRGVLETCNDKMAEDLKRLTGGTLLSRNKEYIVFYRGNDFLPPAVTETLKEREEELTGLQHQEEEAQRNASLVIESNTKNPERPLVAGTLAETVAATSRWGKQMDSEGLAKMLKDSAIARRASLVKYLENKLILAKRKLNKAGRALAKVQEYLQPAELPSDQEMVTDEERFLLRKMGLSMKPFLLLGRREVFAGTIQNMHLHWKFRELVKIIVKGKSFAQVKHIAISLEAESNGVFISIDKTTKGYAIIMYRGKNYQKPLQYRPRNLLTRRQALARSIELQRREALKHHVWDLVERIELIKSELDDMKNIEEIDDKTLYARLDGADDDDDCEELDEDEEAYLEVYDSGDDNDSSNPWGKRTYEELYRQTILQERENQCRTVFRAIFAPNPNPSPSPSPDIVVAASSDGSIASYSISSCLASLHSTSQLLQVAEPLCFLRAHDGPAYDVKFYDNAENSMLLRVRLEPVLELMNPQHKGPWGALSPIPENNAIAIDNEAGSVYAAAGDSCAYCWDLETSKIKTIFKGHTDYVHDVATRKSYNQIITCSEDGTARIWDSRNGKCVQVISPKRDKQRKGTSCITSLALDLSENWLAFGSGQSLYVWNLLVQEQILRISTHMSTQDVLFHDNEILAVGAKPVLSRYDMSGKALSQIQCAPQSAFSVSLHPSGVVAVAGYGGLVDVVSQFGSHLCTFGCKSA